MIANAVLRFILVAVAMLALPLGVASAPYGVGEFGTGEYGSASTLSTSHSGGGGRSYSPPRPEPVREVPTQPHKERPASDVVTQGSDTVAESSPRQLFDIRLTVADPTIETASELRAITRFESFGSEPTPVDLTYTIFDKAGTVVHTETGTVTVEVENIVTKGFDGLRLSDGKYTLVLTTTYNGDITDEFKQVFTVGSTSSSAPVWLPLVLVSAIVAAYALFTYGVRKATLDDEAASTVAVPTDLVTPKEPVVTNVDTMVSAPYVSPNIGPLAMPNEPQAFNPASQCAPMAKEGMTTSPGERTP